MAVMVEWWATRWYTPILALGVLLLILLITALAVVEMFAAVGPSRVPADTGFAASTCVPSPTIG